MYDPYSDPSKRQDTNGRTHFVYPDGQYSHVSGQTPYPPKLKSSRIIGLVAAFLGVAVLFSVLTGVLVYQVFQNDAFRSQLGLFNGLDPSRPGSGNSLPDPDITEETADPQPDSVKPGQNKNFSIGDAAAKDDPNKTALSIIEIAALGRPAVVAISTETLVSTPFGESGTIPAAGSGFIITEDGYVVTNHHVIAGAQSITVMLSDQESYEATLVGTDSFNDLAVLKIEGNNLPTVTLGESADLEVGELAVAIGNALGELDGTVTAGIISALNREITIDGQTMYLLQTDAAINAGNSGGALFNSFGEVIGINTAKNAGSGIEGLGFAIPIDHAKPIIESLIRNGSAIGRPRIGLYTQDLDEATAAEYDLPVGVYIARIEAGSPAEEAGLQEGDVIIAANGQDARTTEAINAIKNTLEPGDIITLTIVRNGSQLDVDVILGEETA